MNGINFNNNTLIKDKLSNFFQECISNQARSQKLGLRRGKIHFLGGSIFVFIMFKTN